MGPVQRFVIVLMLSVQLALTSPTGGSQDYQMGDNKCKLCPAGEYQKSCSECAPCAGGSYTTELNHEDFCHLCDPDCTPDNFNHLKVAQKCTRTSDVKCICEEGFRCIRSDPYTGNCRSCTEKRQDATTTEAAAVPPNEDKHTHSSASPAHISTSSKPCQFPKCGLQSVSPAGNGTNLEDHASSQLLPVLCAVVGCFMVIVILFSIYHFGDETCFKQAITKLYNEGGKDAPHKPKESTHGFTRDSSGAKQQPSDLSDTKLGPVHVHNPGTVIIGLLNQFTGQVGPKLECEKTAERVISAEDDERDCPEFDHTSSPSIHLSEEERSGEIGHVFFPSQEQGKDCHVSKEEML